MQGEKLPFTPTLSSSIPSNKSSKVRDLSATRKRRKSGGLYPHPHSTEVKNKELYLNYPTLLHDVMLIQHTEKNNVTF
jgi:hypothetical protein